MTINKVGSIYCPVGLVIFSGIQWKRERDRWLSFERESTFLYSRHVTQANWLHASICATSRKPEMAQVDDKISVLVDGQVFFSKASLKSASSSANSSAETIALSYLNSGQPAEIAKSLRGCYVCLIIDHEKDEAYCFGDRVGSRPHFIRSDTCGNLIISPTVGLLTRLSSNPPELNLGALSQFLVSRHFMGNETIFDGFEKLPQAFFLKLGRNSVQSDRYWRIAFSGETRTSSEDELIIDADSQICANLERGLAVSEHPFMFLSGGRDSRLLLSYLVRLGHSDIPLVSYGSSTKSRADDDDLGVAQRLADALGVTLEKILTSPQDFARETELSVAAVDGQAEIIDYPDNIQIMEQLATRFTTFINGDEPLDRNEVPRNIEELFNQLGLYHPRYSGRLLDWLQPQARKEAFVRVNRTRHRLLNEGNDPDLYCLKRRLFFEQKVAHYQNAMRASTRANMMQLRPLLDEDFLETVARLPRSLVAGKRLFEILTERNSPQLARIPYASHSSIPLARDIKQALGDDETAKFVTDEIGRRLDDRLGNVLDVELLGRTCRALVVGDELPPRKLRGLARIPGAWRLIGHRLESPIHPVYLLMRLVQINVFLRSCRRI